MRPLGWLTAAALPALLAAAALRADPQVERRYTPEDVYRIASRHAAALDDEARPYARYFSFHAYLADERPRKHQLLSWGVNELSNRLKLSLPVVVPGCDGVVAYLDLRTLGADPAAFDRLALEGSGMAPFPDPFFHGVSEEKKVVTRPRMVEYHAWQDVPGPGGYLVRQRVTGYRTERVAKVVDVELVVQGKWCGVDAALGLSTLTRSQAPVFEAGWFLSNALIEPQYHRLLGLPESRGELEKQAGLQERQARLDGAQLRGALIWSEVAHRNRIVERTPLLRRYGTGSWHQSYDFKTSTQRLVAGKRISQNVLADLLQTRADAFEILFTLRNGLQGCFVAKGDGTRLDFADPTIASDGRTRLQDKLVWNGRNCFFCHLAENGYIPVNDEVRALRDTGAVRLAVGRAARASGRRRDQVEAAYLLMGYEEAMRADRAQLEAAVLACSGLRPREVAKDFEEVCWAATEKPVDLVGLARLTGYTTAEVRQVLATAEWHDNALAGLAAGRKQRRDQIEQAMPQLLLSLYELRK